MYFQPSYRFINFFCSVVNTILHKDPQIKIQQAEGDLCFQPICFLPSKPFDMKLQMCGHHFGNEIYIHWNLLSIIIHVYLHFILLYALFDHHPLCLKKDAYTYYYDMTINDRNVVLVSLIICVQYCPPWLIFTVYIYLSKVSSDITTLYILEF